MIFIDSGAFLAKYLKRDQHHTKAVRIWNKIKNNKERCLTSNFVIDEVLTLLSRKAGSSFSAERARIFYDSNILDVLRPGEEDEIKAIDFMEKYGDHKVSFTDCVSFVLMKKYRIRKAFTFDSHFKLVGFEYLH